MPYISSVGRALPPFKLTQPEVRAFVNLLFSQSDLDIERLSSVFENSRINERYFSVPADWYRTERSFSEKNEKYIESACSLGIEASGRCLQAGGVNADQIDYVIFVSTTGLATPSIDARLINLLSMRSDVRRTPIWGLGCAGGAAGLSHAYHHLLGHPSQRVLLVAVELCGLTFQQHDFSKSNFIATALFGEGAAAVLLCGDDAGDGVEILGTESTFWPDSLDIMGWNLMNDGLQVVFNRNIPVIVKSRVRENMSSFVEKFDLHLEDIRYFVAHPGGAKVIEAYEQALSLSNGSMDIARAVLRDYGNMSAVTVLFVLDEHMKTVPRCSGDYGIISALGPGFCSENLLVRF